MQIVIDISKDDYRKVQDGRASVSMMRKAIRNGTPLPKGHGRLIDADNLIECKEMADDAFEWGVYVVKSSEIHNALTIIEADTESEE